LSLMVITGISVYSLHNYFFDARYYREDNRAAGAFLRTNAAPGDFVIADAPYTALNLQYYLHRSDVTIVGYPSPVPAVDRGGGGMLRVPGNRVPSSHDASDLSQLIGGRNR